MKKVLFLTNIPSPYRVDFFNELGKYVDLTVIFEKKKSDERDDSWTKKKFIGFKSVFLKGLKITVNKALCFSVLNYLKDNQYDEIVCTNFATPTGMIAVEYMIRHKIPYWVEGDGGFVAEKKRLRDCIKRRIFKHAKGLFSTSKSLDEYFKYYGAREKVYRYAFSSMKEQQILQNVVSKEEKQKIREELNIQEEFVVISVGQFIRRKGFDLLIKAAAEFNNKVGFYFIGGIPTDEYLLLQKELNVNNVHYVGFKKTEELSRYYQAADVFAFPTREDIWGLVVNEALAYGLPTISTNKCGAALEMIQENKNGFVIQSENVSELVDRIKQLYDMESLTEFSMCALETAKKYTIEIMAQNHIDVFCKN